MNTFSFISLVGYLIYFEDFHGYFSLLRHDSTSKRNGPPSDWTKESRWVDKGPVTNYQIGYLVGMYDRHWGELRQRVGNSFEYDWEYVFEELIDLTDCLLETTGNNNDPKICLEGKGNIAFYGSSGEPIDPPPPPGYLMSYPYYGCSEQVVIFVRNFLNEDFNAGTFRLWLRIKISQCRGTLKKITIIGTRGDLHKIGIAEPTRNRPKEVFNAFVNGANADKEKIAFVIRSLDKENNFSIVML